MKKIHFISFNVPFPANYGGVISVFYHLKALSELGVKIILHCYQYGREETNILERYAEEVHYYKRNMSFNQLFSRLPFIVNTRKNTSLLGRLLEDDCPIIFEGTHVCYFINHKKLKDRKKIVRMHNVEWQYYYNMSLFEKNIKKKIYFKWESYKLKQFELGVLAQNADAILAISPRDAMYFRENNFSNIHYVPAFHANSNLVSKKGKGNYVLFQGDLSVLENEEVAKQLITQTFAKIPSIQLVIAGRNPSNLLVHLVNQYDNVKLYPNVSDEKMNELLQNAHINLLRAFQPAGMKLKLLNALFQGRFVMTNANMTQNTGLEELCIQVEKLSETPQVLKQYMQKDFSEIDIIQRKKVLEHRFSNLENARITLSLL